MAEFKVGDVAWAAHVGQTQVKKDCPICFGKREVTLILGNGESVLLPCQFCGVEFGVPRGFVMDYEFVAEPERVPVEEVLAKVTAQGTTYQYVCRRYYFDERNGGGFSSRHYEESQLFATEAEARAEAEKQAAKHHQDQLTRGEYLKKDNAKSYSWNAGYHLRAAKQEEASAAYHRQKAAICKERAKPEQEAKAHV